MALTLFVSVELLLSGWERFGGERCRGPVELLRVKGCKPNPDLRRAQAQKGSALEPLKNC